MPVARLVLAFGILFLCSCQRTEQLLGHNQPMKGFGGMGDDSFHSLSLKRKNLAKEKKYLEMELQWLVLRQKQVQSEIELRQALEFENALALEMARYGEFDKRLPGDVGFINPSQRRAWETRLLGRKRESEKAAARVRLIARDMKDLLGKISHHGFIPPTSKSGMSGQPDSDPVIP